MRVGNQAFSVAGIKQLHAHDGQFWTMVHAYTEPHLLPYAAPFCILEDTGIEQLDGKKAYIGEVEKYRTHVEVHFILVDAIPKIGGIKHASA